MEPEAVAKLHQYKEELYDEEITPQGYERRVQKLYRQAGFLPAENTERTTATTAAPTTTTVARGPTAAAAAAVSNAVAAAKPGSDGSEAGQPAAAAASFTPERLQVRSLDMEVHSTLLIVDLPIFFSSPRSAKRTWHWRSSSSAFRKR